MSQSSPKADSAEQDRVARALKLEERVLKLEEKVTFQQHMLSQLNEVVLRQQDELDQQRREMESLRSISERAIELAGGEDLPHEKPPHY